MPVSGSNGYRSGIVTLPNRVKLRQMDERSGLYPTISRTGDKDRGGNFNISAFDDNDTVVYQSVSNIMFGSMTITGSGESVQAYAGNNNPNGGISGAGRLISGISDNPYLTDYKELSSRNNANIENLTFFNESRTYLDDSDFYLTGTSKSSFPGFSGRIHDKTQIQIDLSTSTPTTFGFTEKSTNGDSSDTTVTADLTNIRQQLMVYWNNNLKRWEKIAFGHGPNTHPTGSAGSGKEFYTEMGNLLDTAAIGFGPCAGIVATGSTSGNRDTYSEDVIKTLGKPTSIFGFPSHGKFHATGSQTIKMSEYINKPFLLEKLHLKFDAKFEFSNATSAGRTMFNLSYIRNDGSPTTDFINDFNIFVMPTFFVMRQQKIIAPTTFTRDIPFIASGLGYENSILNNQKNSYKKFYDTAMLNTFSPPHTLQNGAFNLDFTLPGQFKLISGSDETTYVDTDRDLVTFGQIGFYASGSTPVINRDIRNKLPGDKIIMLVDDDHKTSDGNTFVRGTLDTIPALTGTFDLEFKSRIVPVLPPRFGEYIVFTTGSVSGTKVFSNLFHNWEGGRTLSEKIEYPSEDSERLILPRNMRSKGRGIINDIPYFDKGDTSLQKASFYDTDLPEFIQYPKSETIDLDSPYLLFPEDELVFGWQYPYGLDMNTQQPNASSTALNTMTLDGISKLTMFGSLIRDKKEFHDTLNQNLTSEAVHEDIGYEDSICLDQFIINTRQEYSGSYLDDYVTGSAGSIVKSLIGSGENNLSGSFQRFAKCNSQDERYYDTLVLEQISYASKFPENSVGNPFRTDTEIRVDNDIANEILMSFPFEPRFSSVSRTPGSGFESVRKGSLFLFSGFNNNSSFVNNDDRPVAVDITDTLNYVPVDLGKMNYILYGFGSGVSGKFNNSNRISGGSSYNIVERPRGWRYGLWNVFKETTSMIYRMDRYTGQYADVISQRYDTRFFDQETNTISQGPIKIDFVLQDTENLDEYQLLKEIEISDNTSESSNISLYATSSMPFFDELSNPRNRSYDNLASREIEIG